MTKDNQGTATRSHTLSRKGVAVYQRVTGNEGPSPLMKLYLKSRQKRQPAQLTGGEADKTC